MNVFRNFESNYVLLSISEMPRRTVKNTDVFTRMECMYGSIPQCLKTILCHCGFDNALALELIDENAIIDMESFMQEFGKEIINDLNCCNADKYKGQNQFIFTPGHKRTIIGIAEKARELNHAAVSQHSSKNVAELVIVPEPTGAEHQLTTASNDPTEDMSTAGVTSMNSAREDELKSSILNKLKTTIKTKLNSCESAFAIDESNVVALNIQKKNKSLSGSCKCVCPCCGNAVQATCNNGKWKISNIIRHITGHFDLQKNANLTVDNPKKTENGIEKNNTTDDAGNNAKTKESSKNGSEEVDAVKQLEILREFDPYSGL